jgi:hypothetical protein
MLSPEIQPNRELFAYEDDVWAINQSPMRLIT